MVFLALYIILLRHVWRTSSRPYYVAVAQTIGDLVYKLIPALDKFDSKPRAFLRVLLVFDAMCESFARNSDRATLKIAVEHWATRVASPVSVRTISILFMNTAWFEEAVILLREVHLEKGSGLAMFQLALKDAGVVSGLTFLEERDHLGLESLPPAD